MGDLSPGRKKKASKNPEGKPEGRICTLVLFCLQLQGQHLNKRSIHYVDHMCGQTGPFMVHSQFIPWSYPSVLCVPQEGLGSPNPHIDRELWWGVQIQNTRQMEGDEMLPRHKTSASASEESHKCKEFCQLTKIYKSNIVGPLTKTWLWFSSRAHLMFGSTSVQTVRAARPQQRGIILSSLSKPHVQKQCRWPRKQSMIILGLYIFGSEEAFKNRKTKNASSVEEISWTNSFDK